jgi:hypothetical protein
MRKLPIDLEDLAMAMEDHSGAFDHFLDTESGEVVLRPLYDSFDAEPENELGFDDPRYEAVPQIASREGYRLMEDFVDTVEDATLRRLLDLALEGRGLAAWIYTALIHLMVRRLEVPPSGYHVTTRWIALCGNAFRTAATGR